MRKMIKEELHRAIFNPTFRTTLLLLSVIVVVDFIITVNEYDRYLQSVLIDANGEYINNPAFESFTLYNSWIGGKIFSFPSMLFYSLLPIFSALPFSWSYLSDQKIGYSRTLVIKSNKKTYLISKYIATYLSGFLIIFISLTINIMLVACFIPAYTPSIIWKIYYSVGKSSPFSSLFYNIPIAYLAIYILIPSLFSGLFSITSLSLSFITKNKYVVIFAPYIFILIISHILTLAFAYTVWIEVSPLNFLKGASSGLDSNLFVIGLWYIILLSFLIVTIFIERRRIDVF